MYYIVLDLEWNQPWPGSPSAQKKLPVPIHGEIIQIGAVRMLEDQTVADELQLYIKPKYYKRLNKRVSKLTGIKESKLKAEGLDFPDAMEVFHRWCGDECIFLTWGFDDINILTENLKLFELDPQWVQRWYNAQMMYNAQLGGGNQQKALKTALEEMGIEPSRPAHDALGDAYHTACICAKLDLKKGIEDYGKALKTHEDGLHGAQVPGCISRKVFHGYANKQEAFAAMAGKENLCPECGAQMKITKWYPQQGKRYLTMTACPAHGAFLMRIRLITEEDETLQVNRMVYEPDSEAAQVYTRLSEKPRRPKRRSRKARADKLAAKRQQISNNAQQQE